MAPGRDQYASYVWGFDLESESWSKPGNSVGDLLKRSVIPSLAITLPALLITALISIVIGLVSAFNRGKWIDRTYLNAIGWRGIRVRRSHLDQAIDDALSRCMQQGLPMHLLDERFKGGAGVLHLFAHLFDVKLGRGHGPSRGW